MNISEHFTMEEFACHDGTAYPQEWVEDRLKPLCAQLEIIRDFLGRPIKVLSGFRTETYNRKIGGARASQHMLGRAADITIDGISPARVQASVLDMYDRKVIDIGGLGSYPTFTHVDVRPTVRLAQWYGSRTTT